MTEEKILINGLQINYKSDGLQNKEKTILILHGWGKGSDSWENIQKRIAFLGYKTICPDFPGFGKSDTPKTPWNLDDYVKFTENFISQLNLENFFLLGYSFGGRVSIKIPKNKIKGLVLLSSAGIKHKRTFFQYLYKKTAKVSFLPFFSYFRKFFYKFIIRKTDYVKLSGTMKEIFKNIIAENLRPYLSRITIPTLIIWGKKDKITPISDAYIMKKEIPNSTLKVIDNAGHNINLENPTELVKIIDEFVKKL